MMHDSCYDYYFWQGVKDATGPMVCEDVDNPPEFHIDNETTQACKEAWQWGFAFGKGLTEKEYLELITEQETPKEIPQHAEDISVFDSKYEKPLGNC